MKLRPYINSFDEINTADPSTYTEVAQDIQGQSALVRNPTSTFFTEVDCNNRGSINCIDLYYIVIQLEYVPESGSNAALTVEKGSVLEFSTTYSYQDSEDVAQARNSNVYAFDMPDILPSGARMTLAFRVAQLRPIFPTGSTGDTMIFNYILKWKNTYTGVTANTSTVKLTTQVLAANQNATASPDVPYPYPYETPARDPNTGIFINVVDVEPKGYQIYPTVGEGATTNSKYTYQAIRTDCEHYDAAQAPCEMYGDSETILLKTVSQLTSEKVLPGLKNVAPVYGYVFDASAARTNYLRDENGFYSSLPPPTYVEPWTNDQGILRQGTLLDDADIFNFYNGFTPYVIDPSPSSGHSRAGTIQVTYSRKLIPIYNADTAKPVYSDKYQLGKKSVNVNYPSTWEKTETYLKSDTVVAFSPQPLEFIMDVNIDLTNYSATFSEITGGVAEYLQIWRNSMRTAFLNATPKLKQAIAALDNLKPFVPLVILIKPAIHASANSLWSDKYAAIANDNYTLTVAAQRTNSLELIPFFGEVAEQAFEFVNAQQGTILSSIAGIGTTALLTEIMRRYRGSGRVPLSGRAVGIARMGTRENRTTKSITGNREDTVLPDSLFENSWDGSLDGDMFTMFDIINGFNPPLVVGGGNTGIFSGYLKYGDDETDPHFLVPYILGNAPDQIKVVQQDLVLLDRLFNQTGIADQSLL